MRFDVNGYRLTAPGALTFAAGGGGSLAAGEIQVATGVSADMNNKLSGTVGLTKTGGGTLILYNTDASNYTGTTTISAGKLQIGFGVGGSLGRQHSEQPCQHGRRHNAGIQPLPELHLQRSNNRRQRFPD